MAPTIRAIALDVDGVLTDGSFWWGPGGEEFKRFHFLDVMGIARAIRAGLRFALISGEDSPLVGRLASKLRIDDVTTGCKDKASALTAFAAKTLIPLDQVCFMGDDVNDIRAMKLAGYAVAPSNAHELVRAHVAFVTHRPGGAGAVRELIDHLISTGRITMTYEI